MRTRLPAHRTVLLVEDDPDVREGMADILRDSGRWVVEAEDGHDAFAKLNLVGRPCLILLVLSAHGSVNAAEHYPGVIGTLRKPFPVKTLLSWVEALC